MVIIVVISQSVTILQAGHRGVVLFVGAVKNRLATAMFSLLIVRVAQQLVPGAILM